MGITIRRAVASDHDAILELDGASFGLDHEGPGAAADAALEVGPEQFLVAVDDATGRIVGITGDLDLSMTLPGGADLAVAGVTWVSVEITHRRRGILRALIERQLREQRDAGRPASVLLAAESGIYGRFGYGMATRTRELQIDRTRLQLTRDVDSTQVRRLDTPEAAALLPGLYERWRASTPGALVRDDRRWRFRLLDRPDDRRGWTALHHLVHPDGYVSYRLKHQWNSGRPSFTCSIADYAPVTAEAHAALWQVLLAMDLVAEIVSEWVPEDDPIAWLVPDPRQLRTASLRDGLFLRPLDVGRLLASRRYGAPVEAVLDVSDPLFGDGRYLLRGDEQDASCEPTNRAADLRLDAAALGAVLLGGNRLVELARAGVVDVRDDAVLRRLDLALLADRAPFHGTSI